MEIECGLVWHEVHDTREQRVKNEHAMWDSDALNKVTEATWLILPVVICLSQRLSHACLSISFHLVKPQMAH